MKGRKELRRVGGRRGGEEKRREEKESERERESESKRERESERERERERETWFLLLRQAVSLHKCQWLQ